MVTRLGAALAQLEAGLARSHAAIVELLRPGADEAAVSAALEGLGLSPTPELLEWYAWHDGAGADGVPSAAIEIAPGAELYDLGSLCTEHTAIVRVVEELAASPEYPFAATDLWHPSWFPLLRLFDKGFVAVDLAVSGTPVHVVWHDDDPEARRLVAWSSLPDFVGFLLAGFDAGTYSVDDHGLVRGPTLDRPQA